MPLTVVSLAVVVFCLTTGEFAIAGILPDVATNLGVTLAAAGLLVTAYAAGMIVGGPTVTAITARFARKPLILGLIGVSIVGNLGSAIAPNYVLLLGARFVAGLVVATFFAVAISITVSAAAPGKAASAVAKVALGMNLGIILGTPLGTFVGHHFGWRITFLAVALASAAGLLMVLNFIPSQPTPASVSAMHELTVLKDRNVLLAIALTAVGNVGVVMVFTYIAPLLTHVGTFAAGAVPILLLVYGAGAVVGNFLGGWLSDRALMPSLKGLLTALAGTLVLLWLTGSNSVTLVALIFVLGALAFAIIPGMQARVLTAAGAAPTLAVAVNASGFQLAAAFAGWLGGISITSAFGERFVYLLGALLTVAGLALAIYIHRRDRKVTTPRPADVDA